LFKDTALFCSQQREAGFALQRVPPCFLNAFFQLTRPAKIVVFSSGLQPCRLHTLQKLPQHWETLSHLWKKKTE